MGQFAQPQVDSPFFFFRIKYTTISVITAATISPTTIVPRFAINQSMLTSVSYLIFSVSDSLYGFASIYTTKATTAIAKASPTTFRFPVKTEPT